MKLANYTVVVGSFKNPKAFTAEVNAYLAVGWVLVGGFTKHLTEYYQAIAWETDQQEASYVQANPVYPEPQPQQNARVLKQTKLPSGVVAGEMK